jgi:hypothetical protein
MNWAKLAVGKLLRYRPFPNGQAARQFAALFKHAFWAAPRTPAGVRRMLKHPQVATSAWAGGRLAGFARVLTDFVDRAVLDDVVVDPEYGAAASPGTCCGVFMLTRNCAALEFGTCPRATLTVCTSSSAGSETATTS